MKVRRLQSPQPQNKSHLLDLKLHTTENTMICTDGNLDPGWDRHENMMNWYINSLDTYLLSASGLNRSGSNFKGSGKNSSSLELT
jgi:hypothetical protein